eukprot:scaffold199552_cov30-Tisochrysis_lutea.AAC.2
MTNRRGHAASGTQYISCGCPVVAGRPLAHALWLLSKRLFGKIGRAEPAQGDVRQIRSIILHAIVVRGQQYSRRTGEKYFHVKNKNKNTHEHCVDTGLVERGTSRAPHLNEVQLFDQVLHNQIVIGIGRQLLHLPLHRGAITATERALHPTSLEETFAAVNGTALASRPRLESEQLNLREQQ